MRFRIVKCHDRYKPQVFVKEVYNGYQWEDEWEYVGSPDGYCRIENAKNYCRTYKESKEEKVVEEFEL